MPTNIEELVSQLNKETETASTTLPPPSEPATTTVQDNGAFEEEPRRVTEEDLTDKQEPVSPYTADKALKTARSWVRSFSKLLKMIFKPVYRGTVLAKGDIEKMQEFRNKNRGLSETQMEEALHSQHDLYPVANRFDKYLKAVESIELEQDEIDAIAEPLSECIIKYRSLQLGPEWMLLFAVAMVMLPRLTPMMPDLSKIFASAQEKAK